MRGVEDKSRQVKSLTRTATLSTICHVCSLFMWFCMSLVYRTLGFCSSDLVLFFLAPGTTDFALRVFVPFCDALYAWGEDVS